MSQMHWRDKKREQREERKREEIDTVDAIRQSWNEGKK